MGHALVLPPRRDLTDFLKNVLTCHVCLGKVPLDQDDLLQNVPYHPRGDVRADSRRLHEGLEFSEDAERPAFTRVPT